MKQLMSTALWLCFYGGRVSLVKCVAINDLVELRLLSSLSYMQVMKKGKPS